MYGFSIASALIQTAWRCAGQGRIAMVGALLEGAPTKLMCQNNVFESIHKNLKSNFNMVLRLYDTAESMFGFVCFS